MAFTTSEMEIIIGNKIFTNDPDKSTATQKDLTDNLKSVEKINYEEKEIIWVSSDTLALMFELNLIKDKLK